MMTSQFSISFLIEKYIIGDERKIIQSHDDPDLVEDNTYIFPLRASIRVKDFSEPTFFIDFQIFY